MIQKLGLMNGQVPFIKSTSKCILFLPLSSRQKAAAKRPLLVHRRREHKWSGSPKMVSNYSSPSLGVGKNRRSMLTPKWPFCSDTSISTPVKVNCMDLHAKLQLKSRWSWLFYGVPPGWHLEDLYVTATTAYTEFASKVRTGLTAQDNFLNPEIKNKVFNEFKWTTFSRTIWIFFMFLCTIQNGERGKEKPTLISYSTCSKVFVMV